MNIYQALYQATDREIATLTDVQQPQALELVEQLWAYRRQQGGLEHFAFVVQNDASLKAELDAVTNKTVLDNKIMKLAKVQGGYTFTAKEVRAAIKNARPVDEAKAAFMKLAEGRLEAFLNAVKSSTDLQQKIQKSVSSDPKAWATAIAQIGKEAGYSFKAEEIEPVVAEVLPKNSTKDAIENTTENATSSPT